MLCIYFSFKATFNLFYLFFLILPIIFFIYLIFKKKYILLVISIALLSYFFTYTFVFIKNYEDHSFDGNYYTISGKISNIRNYSYSTNLYLTNVSLIDENNNINYIDGCFSVNISENTKTFDIGYDVVFNGKILPVSIINKEGNINTTYIKNNIRFKVLGTVSSEDISFIEGKKSITQSLKDYNKDLLISNLGEVKGNLAYALLYGDRTEVDKDIMNVFKYSGVVHIFAVSGLHISIIVGILYFILKKLKCNNKITFLITAIFLLFYCFLCSFTASVVRATIMSLTLLFSKIVSRKNDSLNTLSFSGLIILLFSPLSLFDAGFQMTFAAVFGILIFMDLFKKVKIKNTIVKKIFLLIAVSISTQITLLPLLAKYYGYYSTWSIVANLFTLPLFSIFYPLLFVTNLICLVFNFLGFIYFLPDALLSVMIFINKLISYIPFGQLSLFYCGGVIATIYYCFVFFVSKYVMIDKKIKPVITGISFVIVISVFLYNTLPLVSTNNNISFSSSAYSNNYSAMISTSNNEFYLINPDLSDNSLYEIVDCLNAKRLNKVNGVIFTGKAKFTSKNIENFFVKYNTKIFLPEGHDSITNLQQMGIEVSQIKYNSDNKINDSLSINYLLINNEFSGTIIKVNDFVYLELSKNYKEFYEIEILENFILDNINYRLNCVKINDSNVNFNKYNSFIKTNRFIFNEDNNITLTI